jgi:cytochrome P450
MPSSHLTSVDLADPHTFLNRDLHELWRSLRTDSPVYWNPPSESAPGFWAVMRYDDIVSVYRDPEEVFTSTRGNVLSTLLQGHDSASGQMLAVSDGPRHRATRALLLKSFTPKALAPVMAKVHARTRRLVAQAIDRGEVDFATDVADQIPINTIGDLMDVPEYDRPQLVEWNTMSLASDGAGGGELDEILARNEILMYFADLAEQRRREPGDDVVSALANGTIDGEPLTEDEIVLNCYSLVLGAEQSSRMSSIGGVLALAEYHDEWRRLKNGDVGLDTATEEILRWTTPAMHMGRRALADTEIGGQAIAKDDIVTLWNTSANFDDEVFADPTRLDLGRKPNKHLAFGLGAHFCLGAFLGRTHLTAALEAVRDLVSTVEVRTPPRRLFSNFVLGYTNAPVHLHGEPGAAGK